MMRLQNTLKKAKEPLPDQKKIRLFVCGPTVYDYAHIGHARTYIFFDVFAKYLRTQGYDVHYLQNITDIDDKIISRAAESGKSPEELALFFTEKYLEDMASLGVNMASTAEARFGSDPDGEILYAPATKFISQILAQVKSLIDKGFGYKIEGDGWYFDIAKDAEYGKLSGRTAEQAEDALTRIDEAVGKRNKGDFCLWKFSKPGEPSWPALIGNGRPGWHIEDTAITEFYFGPHYEIHGGGVDLKFPHHEAEIAQQESLREQDDKEPLAKIWMHTGALLVDGKKMSKSAGNFITIRDFLNDHPADALRWITLTHHYRSPVDYSADAVLQAETTLDSLNNFLTKLTLVMDDIAAAAATDDYADISVDAEKRMLDMEAELSEALDDDMNTPAAIAAIFETVAYLQPKVWTLDPKSAAICKEALESALATLGIFLKRPEIPVKVREIAEEREISRDNKQFKQSDALRLEINALGFDIEDTPFGPFLWPRSKNRN